ncbi:MAG: 50S ribosomal protein L15 [bacterium]
MELHTLKPPAGARKDRKRVGRGPGSGLGKTSGRGHKGAGQRSGYKRQAGKEGGQMPLQRRLPKRGFKNIFRTEFEVVNVADLARLESAEITSDILREAGLVRKKNRPVKLLGNGNVEKAFTVKLNAFSRSAVEKIEAAGGKTEVV